MGSSLTAPTAGFDLNLDPFVCHLEETLGAGEQFSLKAGKQPEGEHVGAEVINDPGQLVDLCWQVELRLVADQVVDASPAGGHGQRHLKEIEPWTDLYGVGRHPEGAGHPAVGPIQLAAEDALEAPLVQVVVDLEGQRALARAHRAKGKTEGCHQRPPSMATRPTRCSVMSTRWSHHSRCTRSTIPPAASPHRTAYKAEHRLPAE